MNRELRQDDVRQFQDSLDRWLETVKEMRSFSTVPRRDSDRIGSAHSEEWISRLLEVRGREAEAHDELLAAIDQLCTRYYSVDARISNR